MAISTLMKCIQFRPPTFSDPDAADCRVVINSYSPLSQRLLPKATNSWVLSLTPTCLAAGHTTVALAMLAHRRPMCNWKALLLLSDSRGRTARSGPAGSPYAGYSVYGGGGGGVCSGLRGLVGWSAASQADTEWSRPKLSSRTFGVGLHSGRLFFGRSSPTSVQSVQGWHLQNTFPFDQQKDHESETSFFPICVCLNVITDHLWPMMHHNKIN
jgi:hypothetical protein